MARSPERNPSAVEMTPGDAGTGWRVRMCQATGCALRNFLREMPARKDARTPLERERFEICSLMVQFSLALYCSSPPRVVIKLVVAAVFILQTRAVKGPWEGPCAGAAQGPSWDCRPLRSVERGPRLRLGQAACSTPRLPAPPHPPGCEAFAYRHFLPLHRICFRERLSRRDLQ